MAGNPTSYGAKLGVDYQTGKAIDHSAPRTTYLALCTADFANNALLTALPEVSTAGYARQPVTWGDSTDAYPSVAKNAAVITFGPVTVDMASPATHAALVTVGTGTAGKIIYKWELDAAQQPVAGQALQIAINKLTITSS
ncbi:hypothetical protein AB0G15_05345 [Streptosporangium sp. NPDC023825]|uniref:phage tail fiber protein n=1 Tax=Streptosporangium sp. NPDC023825 TaxID=3154909 RepID=UPI0034122582